MSHNIDEQVTRFLEYIEIERGRSLKTVANYDRYLRRFVAQSGISSPEEIIDETVRRFRLWLNKQPAADGGTLKKKTQNYYLIALRSFLKYLAKQGVTSLAPERIELASVGARDLDLISTEELDRLLSAPEGDTLQALRDHAIL